MHLEEVLTFIRTTDQEMWNVILREMGITRKRRDEQAARRLSVGNVVLFQAPDEAQTFKGRILKINRGRIILESTEDDQNGFRQISVPAGMLRLCS